MSVKKTFENLIPQVDGDTPVTLDLSKGELRKPEGTQPFVLDAWPILLFMRGVGFERIVFQPGALEVIELWAERIQRYENEFIEDPENFARDEYHWNEKSIDSDQLLIECLLGHTRSERIQINTASSVPPMDAPLGISSEATQSFLDEIRRQSPQEIFQRVLSILVEYERDARLKDEVQWAKLVGDIIAVALHSHLLDKAQRIINEHRTHLEPLWTDADRVLRLLSAYDPKPSELQDWAQIFDGCKTETLLGFLETHLSSTAGPQILKLMNYRAQREPDHLLPHIRSQPVNVQKLLMQWLAPQWRPKHLIFLEGALGLLINNNSDQELFKVWIHAMLRASPKEAFESLSEHFKSPKWFWKKKELNPAFQHALLMVLSEDQSIEVLDFLKSIRKNVSTDLTHQVDKIIDSYRKGRS